MTLRSKNYFNLLRKLRYEKIYIYIDPLTYKWKLLLCLCLFLFYVLLLWIHILEKKNIYIYIYVYIDQYKEVKKKKNEYLSFIEKKSKVFAFFWFIKEEFDIEKNIKNKQFILLIYKYIFFSYHKE